MNISYEGIGQWAATFACTDVSEGQNLPDPEPKRATFRRSALLLFGPHLVWIMC